MTVCLTEEEMQDANLRVKAIASAIKHTDILRFGEIDSISSDLAELIEFYCCLESRLVSGFYQEVYNKRVYIAMQIQLLLDSETSLDEDFEKHINPIFNKQVLTTSPSKVSSVKSVADLAKELREILVRLSRN